MYIIRYTVQGAIRTIEGEIRSWGTSEEQAVAAAKRALRKQYPGSKIAVRLEEQS